MAITSYDPTSYPLIEQIKRGLFEPEKRRHTRMIDQLVEQHSEILNDDLQGFIFNGENYIHTDARIRHRSYRMLAWSLVGDMETFLKDKRQVELDKDQIGQMLLKLQRHVMNAGTGSEFELQEQRDALPDCLLRFAPQLQKFERRYNINFFLRSDRDRRQFEKILPKIEMYSVTGLIY